MSVPAHAGDGAGGHPAAHRAAEATRQGRDLPLDTHLHTDLSPDSAVPIDVYAALAAELGIAELAITDHVDFDRRDPAYDYASFALRERTVREAAERWAPKGVVIRFGAELTFNRSWETDLRSHLATHAYDFTIGSVHDWPDSPYNPSRRRTWTAERSLREVLGPYLDEITAAAWSGLFDTIGHLDVVRRYLGHAFEAPEIYGAVELFEPALRGLVDSGTALEVNTSGYRKGDGMAYPGPPLIARYRELGGEWVTAGSDAHGATHFAYGLEAGYRLLVEHGFEELVVRRGAGSSRSTVAMPERFAAEVERRAS